MPHPPAALHAEFLTVCRAYFPRWRGVHTWTVRRGPRAWTAPDGRRQYTTEHGYCDHSTTTLWISVPQSHWRRVLIHEVCHAVTTGGHGAQWGARMRLAAQRATTLGNEPLSAALREEVTSYAADAPLTTRDISQRVQDLVAFHEASYSAVIIDIAQETGSTGPEVLQAYPRLPAVYAHTKRQALRDLRTRLQFATTHETPPHWLATLQDRLRTLEALGDPPGAD